MAADIGRIFPPAPSVKDTRLGISPNGRYLVDGQGKPFFYLGDTVWTLLKRLNRDEVEEYLQNRAAKGFTVVQTYVVRGLKVANLYGEVTLLNGDPKTPNDKFFQNVDYITNRANELGMVMGFVVTYGEHIRATHTNEQIFDPENSFEFGKYLGRRYRDNAVIWLLGGDRKPLEDQAIWRAMGRGLKEGSQGIHLVSYHGPGDWSTPSSSYWFHEDDWLDFNTIQSGHGWGIPNYDFVTHDYSLLPVKPTLDMESRYENHPDVRMNTGKRMNAQQAREAAYWAVLAGAAGHGYGCNDMWQLYDPDRVMPTPDYAFPYDRLPGLVHWRQAMDFGGAFGVGYMRKLMELRPWPRMVPAQSVIAGGQGTGENHIQAARADDGSFILAYLPFGSPVTVDTEKLSGTRVKAHWYDPRRGEFTYVGQFARGGEREFLPPSTGLDDDWVLALEDADRDYPVEMLSTL